MSILRVATIEPEGATTTLTLGLSGDTVTSSADSIKANTFKDAGGNTLWTSDGSGTLSSINSGLAPAGAKVITSTTGTNTSAIEFTTGIDSSYDHYMFTMVNMFPHTNGENFRVAWSSNAGSSYGITKTGPWFRARHTEGGASGDLAYDSSYDSAQTTDAQNLTYSTGGDADQCYSGILHFFNPSSPTYVKNWYVNGNNAMADDTSQNIFVAGYLNTTTAIDAVKFYFSSGNITGTVTMYGIV